MGQFLKCFYSQISSCLLIKENRSALSQEGYSHVDTISFLTTHSKQQEKMKKLAVGPSNSQAQNRSDYKHNKTEQNLDVSCADDEAAISPDRSNAISPEKPLHQIHNGIPSQLGMQAIPGLQGMQAHALQNQAQAAAHIPGLMPMQSSSIPGLQNYHPGLLSQQ